MLTGKLLSKVNISPFIVHKIMLRSSLCFFQSLMASYNWQLSPLGLYSIPKNSGLLGQACFWKPSRIMFLVYSLFSACQSHMTLSIPNMEVERLQETMVLNVHFITSLSLSFTSFEVTSFGVTCLKVTCWTAPPKQCILARGARQNALFLHLKQTWNAFKTIK